MVEGRRQARHEGVQAMNDHPAHARDLVRDRTRPTVPLTVARIEPDPARPGDPLLFCTQWTGAQPIRLHASDVDVITPAGAA